MTDAIDIRARLRSAIARGQRCDDLLAELDAERARREAAEAQLAALRDAVTHMRSTHSGIPTDLAIAYHEAEATAEQYTRRVRAAALREAAESVSRQESDPCIGWRCHEEVEAWLRADAERIEGGS